MKRPLALCILPAALMSFAGAGHAANGELGGSSSATMTITVIVPPIGAAVAAEQSGAVGIWTISGGSDGLMLDLPTKIGVGAQSRFSLYSANAGPLTATPLGPGGHIERGSFSLDRGLGRQEFMLSHDPQTESARSMTILIASL